MMVIDGGDSDGGDGDGEDGDCGGGDVYMPFCLPL